VPVDITAMTRTLIMGITTGMPVDLFSNADRRWHRHLSATLFYGAYDLSSGPGRPLVVRARRHPGREIK